MLFPVLGNSVSILTLHGSLKTRVYIEFFISSNFQSLPHLFPLWPHLAVSSCLFHPFSFHHPYSDPIPIRRDNLRLLEIFTTWNFPWRLLCLSGHLVNVFNRDYLCILIRNGNAGVRDQETCLNPRRQVNSGIRMV